MAKADQTRLAYGAVVRACAPATPCCRCPPRPRTWPPSWPANRAKTLARDDQTAPGGDPLPAPRRRPPGADRRRLRLRDPGRYPPGRCEEGPDPPREGGRDGNILRRLLAPISDDLRGLRDRAVLLVGFTGALRRSELAAIRFQQLEKTDRGISLPGRKPWRADRRRCRTLPRPRPRTVAASRRPD